LSVFKKILENTSEAIVITDLEGDIVDMNDAMCLMTGYTREELIGNNSRIFKSGRHNTEFYSQMWKSVLQDGLWSGEIWDRKKDGSVYPKWQTINVIHDEQGEPINFIGVSTDISVIKEAEEKLNHLAYFDPLTGLPNRMLFSDRLEHQIACAKRNGSCFAIMFIDLDRFKHVNDSLGHVTGDTLLVQVADRLGACVRTSDTLCRIGGDEFTVILQDLAREDNAGMIASQVVHRLAQRFEVNGSDVYIGASVGIAVFPRDGTDTDSLLRKADAAMYMAKEAGRGMYRYACGEIEYANRSRVEIEAKMHKALERNEFRLFYQPQNLIEDAVPGMNCGLVGAEALIRWFPEDGVMIPPDEFLPVAEDTGFIAPLGDWVLLHACLDAKRWYDAGKPVQVSVNVAARQFDTGNFAHHVSSVLATTGLPPELLKLEVTESGFMRNINTVTEIIRRVRETGVTFAIDDFGRGYCSLNYLNRLPVDCLKIDQSFVRTMDTTRIEGDIVSAIISMARAFGLSTIAEGVETFDQLEALRKRGCDIIQGYLISRPLPCDNFENYLGL
jgi:diguanylate cyclase (GGDEF)-like protein/PAS domain S-box-containing protein